MIKDLSKKIGISLSPDLLKKNFRFDPMNPKAGHCYVASEALFFLAGKEAGYFPVRSKDDQGVVHWWLENKYGEILDPTADQYFSVGRIPPYKTGRRGGFLTKKPSKRARILIRRVSGCLF